MSYTIVWSAEVISSLRRLRTEDPDTAKVLIAAILSLADDPRPEGSNALGATEVRRLRMGDRRVLYEVAESTITVYILKVGTVGR